MDDLEEEGYQKIHRTVGGIMALQLFVKSGDGSVSWDPEDES